MSKQKSNGKPAENIHGAYWEERCKESDRAFDLLEEHYRTRDEMERKFNELDAGCISAAKEYRLCQDADSPRVQSAWNELRARRIARDDVRRTWTTRCDELREAVRRPNDEQIDAFKKAVAVRNQTLWSRLEVSFAEDAKYLSGVRLIKTTDNLGHINQSIAAQLDYVKQVERLRERPLREVLDKIREGTTAYEVARDFPELAEREMNEADFKDLQGLAAEVSRPFDVLSSERGPIKFIHGR